MRPCGATIFAISDQLAGSVWVEKIQRTGGTPAIPATCAASGRERSAMCVGAYLYPASGELSSFVTGQIIEVNGGPHMP
jgi:hypothetical protein